MNANGTELRGADVIVDANINSGDAGTMTVVLNSAQVAETQEYSGAHPAGSTVGINRTADGRTFVRIQNIRPAEMIVLVNHP
jgi:hypothetical protein